MNAQDHLARTRAALEALDPEAIDQAGMAWFTPWTGAG